LPKVLVEGAAILPSKIKSPSARLADSRQQLTQTRMAGGMDEIRDDAGHKTGGDWLGDKAEGNNSGCRPLPTGKPLPSPD